MGKIGYRDRDVMQGKEDEDFLSELAKRLGCATRAQLERWTVRYVLDKVSAAEFDEWVRLQQDIIDKARYDFDDEMLANKAA